jgi:chemotaxis protein MotB
LKADIAELREKKEQVEAESNVYKELTREMKSELAKGEMTIKELKGKLTLDVVDRILFASGEAKVKEEGLEVLRRVVEILKNVKDRDIRIEGHTDTEPPRFHVLVHWPPTFLEPSFGGLPV